MRPVSQEFKDAFLSDTPDVKREVSYKRRYWNAADQEYQWEGSWTVLPADQVISVTPTTEQLDTERLNEFRVSNITLNLNNYDNRWRSDNPSGIFGPDQASPLYFYSDYWMKFRLRIGVKLQDGSHEYTPRFVGLATEYTHGSQQEVQVTVNGLGSLLENANAENVSTRVVNETLTGTVDGVNKEFTTTNPGVGIFEEVSIDGIAETPGTGYSTSQLNEVTLGGMVSFEVAPSIGEVPRATYRYWHQSQTVEDLVEDLLTEAGIPGASQIVDPVLFPSGVLNAIIHDSQDEWQTGTLTGLESTSSPGDLIVDLAAANNIELLDDFTDGDVTANPTWATRLGGTIATVVSGEMKMVGANSPNATASDRVVGGWKFDYRFGATSHSEILKVYFMADRILEVNNNGYSVAFLNTGTVVLERDSSSSPSVSLASASYTRDTSSHTVTITRTASGIISVFIDGTLTLQATDTSYTTSSYFQVSGTGTAGFQVFVDNIYQPKATISATFQSATQDLVAATPVLGTMTRVHSTTGTCTITYETRTSADAMAWDSWEEVTAGGAVQSVARRYIEIRITVSYSSSAMNGGSVQSNTLTYTASAVAVSLANFTGKTVYQAIQGLGAFANYEWGFNADEEFFFRAKAVQREAVASISEADFILDGGIVGLVSGQDRVYSEVRAAYGNFNAIIKNAGDTQGDARAKYGSRVLNIDGGDVLIGDDADMARGIAAIFAADVSRPKRRFKSNCKLMPHVELSDVILVSLKNNKPMKSWHHGDTTVQLGDQDFQHYGPKQQVLAGMYAKVVGVRIDHDNFKTEIDFQEVL